jgi:hypothetical protein
MVHQMSVRPCNRTAGRVQPDLTYSPYAYSPYANYPIQYNPGAADQLYADPTQSPPVQYREAFAPQQCPMCNHPCTEQRTALSVGETMLKYGKYGTAAAMGGMAAAAANDGFDYATGFMYNVKPR